MSRSSKHIRSQIFRKGPGRWVHMHLESRAPGSLPDQADFGARYRNFGVWPHVTADVP